MSWYNEQQSQSVGRYYDLAARILFHDLDGWSEPINTPADDFRDSRTYNEMSYAKAEFLYFQLRYVVGEDAMRAILREYYRRWRLKHVTPAELQEVAEEVSGLDLGWFFDQWLNQTPYFDYAVGDVNRRQLPNGTWETAVTVKRKGDGWMPVEIGDRRRPVLYARTVGAALEETVTFRTPERPGRLLLDPRGVSHDWNFTNNRETGLIDFGDALVRLDTFFREPAARDRRVVSIAPTLWWNDASDATVGVRYRDNYLGRYDRRTLWLSRGVSGVEQVTDGALDFYFAWDNPLFLRGPRASQSLELWSQDGTVGARLQFSKEHRRSQTTANWRHSGWLAQWIATRQTNFLDPSLWENAGTAELGRFDDWNFDAWAGRWRVRLDYRAGATYTRGGSRTRDPKPFGRMTGSGSVRKPVLGFVVGARAFGGVYLANEPPPIQRAIPVHGADPYQTLGNPFLRTEGALLVQDNIKYHAPGNGNLRAYRPGLGGRWILAGTLELEKSIVRRSSGVIRSGSLVAFGDAAVVDTLAVPSLVNSSFAGIGFKPMSDAGIGARVGLRVGDISFPLRVEFPIWVSDPLFTNENVPGRARWRFRWVIGLQPTF